ncbi:MAG: ribonuclease H family protein [Tannerella sp.]|jgi:ribonuclease HI|nr:ribonuclease H family protein [Tannerella sp.]
MKQKYYVVWKGVNPGVYDSWTDCQLQIKGFEGALYKSFGSRDEAIAASMDSPSLHIGQDKKTKPKLCKTYIEESIAVDAACSGNPGDMEYRGVFVETGKELFHVGPMAQGTNNIGEFLALVHGLALLKQTDCAMPVYSDSHNAITWVKNKKCRTKLARTEANAQIFSLIERAEKWLQTHEYASPVLKWETSIWGEIPADFGRK